MYHGNLILTLSFSLGSGVFALMVTVFHLILCCWIEPQAVQFTASSAIIGKFIVSCYRLTKGRIKARQKKMHMIARLLDLPSNVQPCPSPPAYTVLAHRHSDGTNSRECSYLNKVLDSSSEGYLEAQVLFSLKFYIS